MDRIPAEIFTKCCAVQAEGIRQMAQLAAASMGIPGALNGQDSGRNIYKMLRCSGGRDKADGAVGCCKHGHGDLCSYVLLFCTSCYQAA